MLVGVAVGGTRLGSSAVGAAEIVSVGGRNVGVSEGAGLVFVGEGVSVATVATGVGVSTIEGLGEGTSVELGWGTGVGMVVFVTRTRATRVLVGVGVTAGMPGAHRSTSNPTNPMPTVRSQNHRLRRITTPRNPALADSRQRLPHYT